MFCCVFYSVLWIPLPVTALHAWSLLKTNHFAACVLQASRHQWKINSGQMHPLTWNTFRHNKCTNTLYRMSSCPYYHHKTKAANDEHVYSILDFYTIVRSKEKCPKRGFACCLFELASFNVLNVRWAFQMLGVTQRFVLCVFYLMCCWV